MSRRVGVVCAGALLLAMVGCALAPFLRPFDPPGPEQVAVGSVDEVSARLQSALAEEGILWTPGRQGDDFRMAGQTKSGKVFCLHLKRENSRGEKKTRVQLGGDRDMDPEFWPMIVKALTAPASDVDEAE